MPTRKIPPLNPDFCDLLRELYQTLIASNGLKALEVLHARDGDLPGG